MTHPVILETCRKHKVSVEEFFGNGRKAHLTACRIEAAKLLRDRKNSWVVIGRLVGRSRDTVRYWLDPKIRAHRQAYMLKRFHQIYKHKTPRKTSKRIKSQEFRDHILQVHRSCPKSAALLAVRHGLHRSYAYKLAWEHRRAAA